MPALRYIWTLWAVIASCVVLVSASLRDVNGPGGVEPRGAAWPPPEAPLPDLPGTFVPFREIHTCPSLSHRRTPKTAREVRPDDIKVFMALGDSITAGFLARNSDESMATHASTRDRQNDRPLIHRLFRWSPLLGWNVRLDKLIAWAWNGSRQQDAKVDVQTVWREWRGLSYPIGGDKGAITLPNILARWTDTTGQSYTPSLIPPIFRTLDEDAPPLWGKDDGLNGAVSGSTSASLLAQVQKHILPRMDRMEIADDEWKFVNIGIGANDVCAFCLSGNSSIPSLGSPEEFARGIKDAVVLLRKHIPHLIVNIIGLFKVSALYQLTLKDPYCKPVLLPPLPHLPLECSCAFLPGLVGDYTRRKMDDIGEAYDVAVLQVVKDWLEEGDDTFGVMWQPGTLADLESWPIEALSPIDCFHPSEAAHQRVAAGLWNRLTLRLEEKSVPVRWTGEVYVRCLEEDDRFQFGL